MKSLRAQEILHMGKIVQVPVEGTVSGYKLICAGVPPAPAAHQGKLSSSLWKQLVSPGQGRE